MLLSGVSCFSFPFSYCYFSLFFLFYIFVFWRWDRMRVEKHLGFLQDSSQLCILEWSLSMLGVPYAISGIKLGLAAFKANVLTLILRCQAFSELFLGHGQILTLGVGAKAQWVGSLPCTSLIMVKFSEFHMVSWTFQNDFWVQSQYSTEPIYPWVPQGMAHKTTNNIMTLFSVLIPGWATLLFSTDR